MKKGYQNKSKNKFFNKIIDSSQCLSIDQLWAYKKNKMVRKERYKVEKHLAECQLCAQAWEGLEDYSEEEFRNTINQFHQQIDRITSPVKITRPRWIYAVAAVLVLGLLTLFYSRWGQSKSEILFNRYFEPYPSTLRIVRGNTTTSTLKQAVHWYERKEYKKALPGLEEMLKTEPSNPFLHFYTGMSFLCLDRPEKAIPHFRTVLALKEHPFLEPASWYLGLAFLKEGEMNKAKSIFQDIASSQNAFREESENLLQKMN